MDTPGTAGFPRRGGGNPGGGGAGPATRTPGIAGGSGGGGGGGAPPRPGPTNPGSSGANTPSFPGAAGLRGGTATPTTPSSPAVPIQAVPDVQATYTLVSAGELDGSWLLWWQLHAERYLRRPTGDRVTQHTDLALGRPRPEVVYGDVLPALLAALEGTKDARLQRAAMTAIARIGAAPESVRDAAQLADAPTTSALSAELAKKLASARVETIEDAVLALGILGAEADAMQLASLTGERARFGAANSSERVPARLRAFAAYALGLLAQRTDREDVRRFVAHRLWSVASEPDASVNDVPVASVLAYGLVPLTPRGCGADECDSPSHCREGQVRGLLALFADKDYDPMVRAHALTAAARLASADPVPQALREEALRAALDTVRARSRERRELRWSAVTSLGLLADADGESLDHEAREKLEELVHSGKDLVERQFATLALADAGSRPGSGGDAPLAAVEDVRRFLVRRMDRSSSRDAVWSALALGVQGRNLVDVGQELNADADRALVIGFEGVASPYDAGAYALALGLRRATVGAEALQEQLVSRGNSDRRSFAALGLGLMAYPPAVAQLAEITAEDLNQPGLHFAASLARGMCGDRRNTAELVAQLGEAETYLERITLAGSLGLMGDERAVAPLLEVLGDEAISDDARAAAAQALGELCDPADAPWHRALVDGLNYLAAPGSLLGSFGVLDRR